MEKRLRERATDDEDRIKQRLEIAIEEIKHSEVEGFYDKIIVNDNLNEAFDELEKYIFQTDVAGAEETPAAEGSEDAAEAVTAAAEGDDTTMAEGGGEAAEKE